MKQILFIFSITLLIFSNSTAGSLPTLNIPNWQAYHAISQSKYHTVAVGTDGSIELFFMDRDKRVNLNWPIKLEFKLERRTKSKSGVIGKWVSRKVKKSGFINPSKAAKNPDKLTLHGVVTGDVEFKLNFNFTKEGVLFKAELVGQPKDANSAEYRLSLASQIDDLVNVEPDDRNDIKKIKNKTRGDDLRIITRKGKERIKFHEVVETEKLDKDKVVSMEIRADKIGRKKLFWSLADPKLGSLSIEPKAKNKMPYDGLKITTVLIDEAGNRQCEGILLEYK